MPTDIKSVVTTKTGRTVPLRLVMLEHDEHLLLMREGRGYVAAIPMPLCKHRHRRMENAAICGLKAAEAIVARTNTEGEGDVD